MLVKISSEAISTRPENAVRGRLRSSGCISSSVCSSCCVGPLCIVRRINDASLRSDLLGSHLGPQIDEATAGL